MSKDPGSRTTSTLDRFKPMLLSTGDMTTKVYWPGTPILPPFTTDEDDYQPLGLSIETAPRPKTSHPREHELCLHSPRSFSTPNLQLRHPEPQSEHPRTPTLPYHPVRHVSSTYIDWVASRRNPSLADSPDFPNVPEPEPERARLLIRSRSLSRTGSAFRYPRSPGFEDRREGIQSGEVTVSEGVTATGVSGVEMVVGERKVGGEAKGKSMGDETTGKGKMGKIMKFLIGPEY